MADELDIDPFDAAIEGLKQRLMELGASPQQATQAAAEIVQTPAPPMRQAPGGPLEVDIGAPRRMPAPTRMQAPDRSGVTAGEYGLPPMRNALSGEIRGMPEPMPGDRLAATLMGDERASPERRRAVEMLTGYTGLGRSENVPISMMDAVPLNPLANAATHLSRDEPKAAAMEMAPFALPVVGGLARSGLGAIGRAATTNPVKSGIAAGGAALMSSPSEAGTNDVENIKSLQRELQSMGLYNGPIDGNRGPGTQEAIRKRQELDANRERTQLESRRVDAETRGAEAELAKQERLRMEAEQANARRLEGEKRMREVDQNTPWYSKAIRDYGPNIGYALGLGAGALARKGVAKAGTNRYEGATERANALIPAEGKGDWPARVGAVNQFWGEGQGTLGTPQAPFLAAPGNKKAPFKSNPEAPPGAELYQKNRLADYGTDAGVTAGFGAESAMSQFMLQPKAESELQKAREEVAKDPSEANIQRLNAAMDRLALSEMATNFGRLGAASFLGTAPKMQRQMSRPDIASAEAERARIDAYLSRPGGAKGGNGSPAAPVTKVPKGHYWDDAVERVRHEATGRFSATPQKK